MKRLGLAIVLMLVAHAARAEITATDLAQFQKGESGFTQITAKFGAPSKSEVNDEGLRAIAYLGEGAKLDDGSVLPLFGAAIGETGADRLASLGGPVAVFLFDKRGLLVLWRAEVKSGATDIEISSEDGASAMPNVISNLPGENDPWPDPGDKPQLGIRVAAIEKLEAKYRTAFAAAHFVGQIVVAVRDDSVAQRAGIKKDDYLYVLNGVLLVTPEDVTKAMATVHKGQTIVARAKRIDQSAHVANETTFNLKF